MSMRRGLVSFAWMMMAAATSLAGDKAPGLTAADVIARHLESIGTAEARAAAGGRAVKGPVKYVRKPVRSEESDLFAGRPTSLVAPLTVASGGPRYLIAVEYGWKDYPLDRIVYDGKKVKNARMLSPGNYTVLAGLLNDNQYLLKAGLLGGPLTTAWALLAPDDRFEKLEYAGIKKAAGQQAHRLDARLKSDPEHEIFFFFDLETFRLVRTEVWIGPNARRKFEEDFADYKTVHGLSLPHSWTMALDAPEDTWKLTVEEVVVASELPAEAFASE